MSKRLSGKEQWELQQIPRATHYVVCRFEGVATYTKEQAKTLDEARTVAKAMGPGPFGRVPMIYAITPEGWSVHVENLGEPRCGL